MDTYCDNEYLYECIMKTDPAPCGLYPHEIIFLWYFTIRSVRLDNLIIPNAHCMYVNYSQLLLKSMIDRGFIRISNNDDLKKILNLFDNEDLKKILSKKFNKLPKRRDEKIALALSIPKDELNNIIGTRFYFLTEKGYDIVKNNKDIIDNRWGHIWNKEDSDISKIKKDIKIVKIKRAKIKYKNNTFLFGLNDLDILSQCHETIYFEYPVEVEVIFGNANYKINATEFKILNKLNGIILLEKNSDGKFNYDYVTEKGIELKGICNTETECISTSSDNNTIAELEKKYQGIHYYYKDKCSIKTGKFCIYCSLTNPLIIEVLQKKNIGAKVDAIPTLFENDYSNNVCIKLNADNYYAMSLIAFLLKKHQIKEAAFFGIGISNYYNEIQIFKSSKNKLQSLIEINNIKLFNNDDYCDTILKMVNLFNSLSSFCEYVCQYIPYNFIINDINSILDLCEHDFNIKNSGFISEYEYKLRLEKWENEYNKNLFELYNDGTIIPKWKNEYLLYFMFSVVFEDAQYQYRAKWLGLQSLDIYIPSLNVGIEYQGQQHYQPIDYFGGKEKLNEQKERDLTKKKLCIENGVKLLEWKYDTEVNIENFNIFLKDNNINAKFSVNEKSNMPLLKNIESNTKNKKTVICQYDKSGVLVKKYKTEKEASFETNTSYSGIQRAIAGQQNLAGDFLWRKYYFDDIPDLIRPVNAVYSNNNSNQDYLEYEIKQVNKVTGEAINSFENMTQASKITGIDYTSIRRAVNGKQKSAGGYKWIKIKKVKNNA